MDFLKEIEKSCQGHLLVLPYFFSLLLMSPSKPFCLITHDRNKERRQSQNKDGTDAVLNV